MGVLCLSARPRLSFCNNDDSQFIDRPLFLQFPQCSDDKWFPNREMISSCLRVISYHRRQRKSNLQPDLAVCTHRNLILFRRNVSNTKYKRLHLYLHLHPPLEFVPSSQQHIKYTTKNSLVQHLPNIPTPSSPSPPSPIPTHIPIIFPFPLPLHPPPSLSA